MASEILPLLLFSQKSHMTEHTMDMHVSELKVSVLDKKDLPAWRRGQQWRTHLDGRGSTRWLCEPAAWASTPAQQARRLQVSFQALLHQSTLPQASFSRATSMIASLSMWADYQSCDKTVRKRSGGMLTHISSIPGCDEAPNCLVLQLQAFPQLLGGLQRLSQCKCLQSHGRKQKCVLAQMPGTVCRRMSHSIATFGDRKSDTA